MALAALPRSERWLFGPLPDLLLGCGLLYGILFAAHSFAGPALVGMTPPYLLPLLILLFSAPHYGGTLVRVYDQRRDRRAYVVFSVWITLAMSGLFLVALHQPFLASVLFTLYLTWSPWHYSGQNYGLAVMFLRRRQVEVTPQAKHWLYASFLLSFALAAIVSHLEVGSAYSPLAYQGQSITFLPIGITRGFGDVVLPIVGAAYLASVVVSAYLLRRAARWRDLLPSFALVLTQALWFVAPFSVRYWGWHTGLAPLDAQAAIANYAVMIFLGHGIQYLWITTYYARAGGQWHGYANYWAKVVAAGLAIWTLPVLFVHPFGLRGRPDLAATTLTVIGTFVNLHHFVLDGAIWKLRNTRIAAVLIRNAPEPEGGEPARRSAWLRRLVWSTAGAAVVAGFAGFGLTSFYVPSALARGDLAVAEIGIDVGAWLGSEDPLLRVALAEAMIDRGDKERAAALLERLVVAIPAGTTYALLGRVEAMRGNADAARVAFETALAKNVPHADRVHAALASLALKRGDEAAASEHYRSAIALHPSATSVANDFAWLLATANDPGVRDAKTSVEVAEQLVTMDDSPNHFDTLAAAYAAAGRWDDAVRAASRAAELAEQRRDNVLLADIRRNLDRYRARQTAAR